ncbi:MULTISPECIES: molecular chaperone DnaJ [unclassified Polaribacter]|uniref:molecular chaperone DnaJ n=1 Tax=unclassified Polaribacter TaxID=196858 RepID=UPI0011BDBF18|nr:MULTISPECIES: molecular chaperone DnaJ [unclassified Polaribacter]TXD51512.1 molecular chaperone DnaJ [Polaribacter sp. IC063]TXD58111.1 molecular chaperone DnaJ [Polaribacter sp. IC066]
MAKQDFYDILDISKSASQAEIKKGYRKMAIKYHPDKNPDDKTAEENFKKAAEAYEVLSDENKKARYDQYGHQAFDGPQSGGGGFGGGGMNMDDIFSQFGDIFGGGGGGFGGGFGGGGRQQARVKGSNMRIRVKLTLEEIAKGVEKKVKVRRKVQADGVRYKTCTTCNGSGQQMRVTNTILGRMQTATTCGTCSGAGEIISSKPNEADAQGLIIKEETVPINIPAGVTEGVQLKVGGKGNDAPGKNSIAGDLLVLIEEVPHETLKREGTNIHYDLYINFSEAVLGTSKEVETVTGKVKIKIDAGTQSGRILRLKGKGLPSIERYGTGDFLIHTNVWTPQQLNKEQTQFFEKMTDDDNFAPSPNTTDKSFFEKVKDMFS